VLPPEPVTPIASSYPGSSAGSVGRTSCWARCGAGTPTRPSSLLA